MFTSIDKALVAAIGAAVYFLAQFGITIPWLTPEIIENIAVGLTPILVWLIPNKTKAG